MAVLGIWDGHDSGAALVADGRIVAAVNEERFTRRKVENRFPSSSILECMRLSGLSPGDIDKIAVTTSDLSMSLFRLSPWFKERYYLYARRKCEKPKFDAITRALKYKVGEFGPSGLWRKYGEHYFRGRLAGLGFSNYKLEIVDHHTAHAASAYYTSGFGKALCVTIDGLGDGICCSVNVCDGDGEIRRIASSRARDSIGVFYEQVTHLVGFKALEDGGKVMSLADYAYPVPDAENPTIGWFHVEGLTIKSRHSAQARYMMLDKLLWKVGREQLAYMAQRTLERTLTELFKNAVEQTGIRSVCWSGGVASNIKANMKIRDLSGLKEWFVFPHMSDGGLPCGAALYLSNKLEGSKGYRLESAYLGTSFSGGETESCLKGNAEKVRYEKLGDPAGTAADLVADGGIVFWFQGKMELGPRALGARSILALPGDEEVKNRLNIQVKRRNWFQPFCPSLLEEEASRFFEDAQTKDKFMTMGYTARPSERAKLKAVIHVDGSARPQMLGRENPIYRLFLENLKKRTGNGIVLNTSFNIHGDPIVCSPADAIDTLLRTKNKTLIIGDYLVSPQ